ncbi:MAG: hypothetical protein U0234_14445 [Sandaracinus sp.]
MIGASLAPLALIGMFILLFVVLIAFSVQQRNAAIAAWQRFSQETGIPLTGTYPMTGFHGSYRGATISLQHEMWRGHKGHRHYRHDLAVRLPIHTNDLSVTREGLADMIGKVFGGQDIQVGDAPFDAAFRIRGSSEELARDVLTPGVRAALLEAVRSAPMLHLDGGCVRVTQAGIARAEQIQPQLDALLAVVQAFERDGAGRGGARFT